MKIILAALVAAGLWAGFPAAAADSGLDGCADHFPNGLTAKAPKPAEAAPNNIHICERSGDVSFFALEYAPSLYAPLWVNYRIANTFGEGGCASMPRSQMQCHFSADDVETCIKKKKGADPFHADAVLTKLKANRLTTSDFSGTGHDRGHMAPNNAFSWHACGAYKTFTMANMSAQWATLNRALWANLEAQMLFWGVKNGPVLVTVGPVWQKFPSEKFEAIQKGVVKTDSFPEPGVMLAKTDDTVLKKMIPRPTGFYMIAFSPGGNGEPERVIAFLVPHTKQEGLSFWNFVATVKLVEETSGLRFGFADQLKNWPDLDYWRDPARKIPSGWDIRGDCTTQLPVAGWKGDRPLSERLAICRSADPVN